jgi:uncharacterized protein (UPF0276 family)
VVVVAVAEEAAVAADRSARDGVGLGWRPELAADILTRLEDVDVVEVIADDWFEISDRRLRGLRLLASEVPVVLHGVGLGLASCTAVEPRRLEAMARVVGAVRPAFWSEHLAFVRAGGREIGHLAAPPRFADTIDGTAANVERARRIVGAAPLLENVATLVGPPGSMNEADWISRAIEASDTTLLLDLHNLHANAANFGFEARAALDHLPIDRVHAIHLAGGRWATAPDGRRRLVDDHLHDVPDPVFALLEDVAARVPQPLTVILERDGHYPPFDILRDQLDAARRALAAGRLRRAREAVA